MAFSFATCNRSSALSFLQRVCPSKGITDTPDSAGPLLDLVEKDLVRVQDPMMHGNRIAVIPGKKWKEDQGMRDTVVKACKVFSE